MKQISHAEYSKEWRRQHPNYSRKYHQQNRETYNAYNRNWYNAHANPKYYSDKMKRLRLKYRQVVLEHYGGGNPPKCACCGESKYEFLAIDHINGKGRKQKEEYKAQGGNFYNWIIRNNFPPIFQILCHNCNCAKGYYGSCPHMRIVTT